MQDLISVIDFLQDFIAVIELSTAVTLVAAAVLSTYR